MTKNTRLLIVHIGTRYVQVQHMRTRRFFLLPRITFKFRPPYCNYDVVRNQYPLRLAYASTFNSCQGLTVEDHCVYDFRVDPFAHGQLYTALTRIRDRQAGTVLLPDDVPDVRNVVLPMLLQ
jgi:hypothetical protein